MISNSFHYQWPNTELPKSFSTKSPLQKYVSKTKGKHITFEADIKKCKADIDTKANEDSIVPQEDAEEMVLDLPHK